MRLRDNCFLLVLPTLYNYIYKREKSKGAERGDNSELGIRNAELTQSDSLRFLKGRSVLNYF